MPAAAGEPERYQVSFSALDVFNPITMEVDHRQGNDVPAWFLCTDYNDLCFHISQAFFPRTSAWDNLKRSSRAATKSPSGSTWPARPAPRSRPARTRHGCRQGDRRPRQRADGGEEAGRGRAACRDRSQSPREAPPERRGGGRSHEQLRSRQPDPLFALRGAGPALVHPRRRGAGAAPGRRPAVVFPPATRKSAGARPTEPCSHRALPGAYELCLVNLIRERVKDWRRQGYPGVTRTTLELLQ